MRALLWSCGGLVVVSALALATSILHYFALSPFGMPLQFAALRPLSVTLLIVIIALCVAGTIAFFAAASTVVETSGMRARSLQHVLGAGNRFSSVVIGLTVLIAARFAGIGELPAMIAALVLFNLHPLTNAFVRGLSFQSPERRQAAAAAGASSLFTCTALLLPSASRSFAAAVLRVAANMIGQTALLALVAKQNLPLSVALWRDATDVAAAHVNAVRALLLIAMILVLHGISRRVMPSQGSFEVS